MKEVAEITTHSKILSAEEKLDVYVYMATGNKLETLKFLLNSRQTQETAIDRFAVVSSTCWNCNRSQDTSCIQKSVNVYFSGVGLYGGTQPSTHHVMLQVLKETETVYIGDGDDFFSFPCQYQLHCGSSY